MSSPSMTIKEMPLVERVARALAVADGKDPDVPAWVEGYGNREKTFGVCWRDQYSVKAQAAIDAMGSPEAVTELREALENARRHLRGLQPSLNVMAREVLDDIIADNIDAALLKVALQL